MPEPATIIVVEDDAGARVTLCGILEDAGYKVIGLGKGADALEEIQKKSIEVIITDIRLPDVDGMEILQLAKETNPDTAVIMMTGYASVETAINAVNEGAYAYFIKPVNPDELKTAITNALKQQRLSLENKKLVESLQHSNKLFYEANEALKNEITERRQAEEKIQELYHKETELRQKLEAEIDKRIEFTRALVHELKTPLTPMVAASELLMEEIPEGALFRIARSINAGSNTLSKRIDQLLDVARGEVGLLELDYKEIDLLEFFHKVADDMTPLASSSDQQLNLKLPISLPPVWVDEDRLRQVVVNLLGNSFKFTPEGGKITLRVKNKDDALIVEVEDTGYGIPVDQQQQLFEAYYRVKSERQTRSGLGLGLALCKMIVELHGGKIWFESQPGKGSTFSFSLPLKAANKRKKASEHE